MAVRQAMSEMPAKWRQTLELAYFGGMTQIEIAEVLGEPLGTVKTRVRSGLLKLRHCLSDLVYG
jgi:RNA polymerase sigma-70 factor (ECF subfamily)